MEVVGKVRLARDGALIDAHLLSDDINHFGFDLGFRHGELS